MSKELIFLIALLIALPTGFLAFLFRRFMPKPKGSYVWFVRIVVGLIFLAPALIFILLLSPVSIEQDYPGLTVFVTIFPAAIIYNYLYWRFLVEEVAPASSSFFIWFQQKGFVTHLIAALVAIRFFESVIVFFDLFSGLSLIIVSVGIPLAILIGITRVAREDIESALSEDDLVTPFDTSSKSIEPHETISGVKIIYFFDPQSKICQEFDKEIAKQGDVFSLDVRSFQNHDFKVSKTPTIIGYVAGQEIGRIDGFYSKERLEKMMIQLRRKINIVKLSDRRDSEN